MKNINRIAIFLIIPISIYAKDSIKINYETLDFDNSKKKEDGKRYGIMIEHNDKINHIQAYYEKTYTDTTPIVPKDLEVKKYTLKYQYKINPKERLTLSYATIDDNLMKETNGGDIYGVGYSKNNFGFTQYFSDYPHFNVYQSDLKYTIKGKIQTTLIGKYIHLEDKNSNNFSKNAKNSYFTAGIKLHKHYYNNKIHLGAGAYFGKRIFAIMKDGFKVQHHAMEFKETYMCGVGYSFNKDLSTHLRYIYQKAKEIPINNDNVKVQNISLDFIYKF